MVGYATTSPLLVLIGYAFDIQCAARLAKHNGVPAKIILEG